MGCHHCTLNQPELLTIEESGFNDISLSSPCKPHLFSQLESVRTSIARSADLENAFLYSPIFSNRR